MFVLIAPNTPTSRGKKMPARLDLTKPFYVMADKLNRATGTRSHFFYD